MEILTYSDFSLTVGRKVRPNLTLSPFCDTVIGSSDSQQKITNLEEMFNDKYKVND